MKRKNKKLLIGLGSTLATTVVVATSIFGISQLINRNNNNNLNNENNKFPNDYKFAKSNYAKKDFFTTTQNLNWNLSNVNVGQTITPYGWLGNYSNLTTNYDNKQQFNQNTLTLTSWNGTLLWVNNEDSTPIYDAKYIRNVDQNNKKEEYIFVLRNKNGQNANGLSDMYLTIHNVNDGKIIAKTTLNSLDIKNILVDNFLNLAKSKQSVYQDILSLDNQILFSLNFDLARYDSNKDLTLFNYLNNINSFLNFSIFNPINNQINNIKNISVDKELLNNNLNEIIITQPILFNQNNLPKLFIATKNLINNSYNYYFINLKIDGLNIALTNEFKTSVNEENALFKTSGQIFKNHSYIGSNIVNANTKLTRNIFNQNQVVIPYIYADMPILQQQSVDYDYRLPFYNVSLIDFNNNGLQTPFSLNKYINLQNSKQFNFNDIYDQSASNNNDISYNAFPSLNKQTLHNFNRVITVNPFDNTIIYSAKPNVNAILNNNNDFFDGRDEFGNAYVSLWITNFSNNSKNITNSNSPFYLPLIISNTDLLYYLNNNVKTKSLPSQFINNNDLTLFLNSLTFNPYSLTKNGNNGFKLSLMFEQSGTNKNNEAITFVVNNKEYKGLNKTSQIGLIDFETKDFTKHTINNLKTLRNDFLNYNENVKENNLIEIEYNDVILENSKNKNTYALLNSKANLEKIYPISSVGFENPLTPLLKQNNFLINQKLKSQNDNLPLNVAAFDVDLTNNEVFGNKYIGDNFINLYDNLITQNNANNLLVFANPDIYINKNNLNPNTLEGDIEFNLTYNLVEENNLKTKNASLNPFNFNLNDLVFNQTINLNNQNSSVYAGNFNNINLRSNDLKIQTLGGSTTNLLINADLNAIKQKISQVNPNIPQNTLTFALSIVNTDTTYSNEDPNATTTRYAFDKFLRKNGISTDFWKPYPVLLPNQQKVTGVVYFQDILKEFIILKTKFVLSNDYLDVLYKMQSKDTYFNGVNTGMSNSLTTSTYDFTYNSSIPLYGGYEDALFGMWGLNSLTLAASIIPNPEVVIGGQNGIIINELNNFNGNQWGNETTPSISLVRGYKWRNYTFKVKDNSGNVQEYTYLDPVAYYQDSRCLSTTAQIFYNDTINRSRLVYCRNRYETWTSFMVYNPYLLNRNYAGSNSTINNSYLFLPGSVFSPSPSAPITYILIDVDYSNINKNILNFDNRSPVFDYAGSALKDPFYNGQWAGQPRSYTGNPPFSTNITPDNANNFISLRPTDTRNKMYFYVKLLTAPLAISAVPVFQINLNEDVNHGEWLTVPFNYVQMVLFGRGGAASYNVSLYNYQTFWDEVGSFNTHPTFTNEGANYIRSQGNLRVIQGFKLLINDPGCKFKTSNGSVINVKVNQVKAIRMKFIGVQYLLDNNRTDGLFPPETFGNVASYGLANGQGVVYNYIKDITPDKNHWLNNPKWDAPNEYPEAQVITVNPATIFNQNININLVDFDSSNLFENAINNYESSVKIAIQLQNPGLDLSLPKYNDLLFTYKAQYYRNGVDLTSELIPNSLGFDLNNLNKQRLIDLFNTLYDSNNPKTLGLIKLFDNKNKTGLRISAVVGKATDQNGNYVNPKWVFRDSSQDASFNNWHPINTDNSRRTLIGPTKEIFQLYLNSTNLILPNTEEDNRSYPYKVVLPNVSNSSSYFPNKSFLDIAKAFRSYLNISLFFVNSNSQISGQYATDPQKIVWLTTSTRDIYLVPFVGFSSSNTISGLSYSNITIKIVNRNNQEFDIDFSQGIPGYGNFPNLPAQGGSANDYLSQVARNENILLNLTAGKIILVDSQIIDSFKNNEIISGSTKPQDFRFASNIEQLEQQLLNSIYEQNNSLISPSTVTLEVQYKFGNLGWLNRTQLINTINNLTSTIDDNTFSFRIKILSDNTGNNVQIDPTHAESGYLISPLSLNNSVSRNKVKLYIHHEPFDVLNNLPFIKAIGSYSNFVLQDIPSVLTPNYKFGKVLWKSGPLSSQNPFTTDRPTSVSSDKKISFKIEFAPDTCFIYDADKTWAWETSVLIPVSLNVPLTQLSNISLINLGASRGDLDIKNGFDLNKYILDVKNILKTYDPRFTDYFNDIKIGIAPTFHGSSGTKIYNNQELLSYINTLLDFNNRETVGLVDYGELKFDLYIESTKPEINFSIDQGLHSEPKIKFKIPLEKALYNQTVDISDWWNGLSNTIGLFYPDDDVQTVQVGTNPHQTLNTHFIPQKVTQSISGNSFIFQNQNYWDIIFRLKTLHNFGGSTNVDIAWGYKNGIAGDYVGVTTHQSALLRSQLDPSGNNALGMRFDHITYSQFSQGTRLGIIFKINGQDPSEQPPYIYSDLFFNTPFYIYLNRNGTSLLDNFSAKFKQAISGNTKYINFSDGQNSGANLIKQYEQELINTIFENNIYFARDKIDILIGYKFNDEPTSTYYSIDQFILHAKTNNNINLKTNKINIQLTIKPKNSNDGQNKFYWDKTLTNNLDEQTVCVKEIYYEPPTQNTKLKIYINNINDLLLEIKKYSISGSTFELVYNKNGSKVDLPNDLQNPYISYNGQTIFGLRVQYSEKTDITNQPYNSANANNNPLNGWVNNKLQNLQSGSTKLFIQLVADEGYIWELEYLPDSSNTINPDWINQNTFVIPFNLDGFTNYIGVNTSQLLESTFDSTFINNLSINENQIITQLLGPDGASYINNVKLEFQLFNGDGQSGQPVSNWISLNELKNKINSIINNYSQAPYGIVKMLNRQYIGYSNYFIKIRITAINDPNSTTRNEIYDNQASNNNLTIEQKVDIVKKGVICNTDNVKTKINLQPLLTTLTTIKSNIRINNDINQSISDISFPAINYQGSTIPFDDIKREFTKLGITFQFSNNENANDVDWRDTYTNLNSNQIFLRIKVKNPQDKFVFAQDNINNLTISDSGVILIQNYLPNGVFRLFTNIPQTINITNNFTLKLNQLKSTFSGNTYHLNANLSKLEELYQVIYNDNLALNGINNVAELKNIIEIRFSLGDFNNPILINGNSWFNLSNFIDILSRSNLNYDTNQINFQVVLINDIDHSFNLPIVENKTTGILLEKSINPSINPIKMYIHSILNQINNGANFYVEGNSMDYTLNLGQIIYESKVSVNDPNFINQYYLKDAKGLKIQFTTNNQLQNQAITNLQGQNPYPNSQMLPEGHPNARKWLSYLPNISGNYLALQFVADLGYEYEDQQGPNWKKYVINTTDHLQQGINVDLDKFNSLQSPQTLLSLKGYSNNITNINLVEEAINQNIALIRTLNSEIFQQVPNLELNITFGVFRKSNSSEISIFNENGKEFFDINTLNQKLMGLNEWIKFNWPDINVEDYCYIKARVEINSPTSNYVPIWQSIQNPNDSFVNQRERAKKGIALTQTRLKTKINLSNYVNILRTEKTKINFDSLNVDEKIVLPNDINDLENSFLNNKTFDYINQLLNKIGIEVLFQAPGFNGDAFVAKNQINEINSRNQLNLAFKVNFADQNWASTYELIFDDPSNTGNGVSFDNNFLSPIINLNVDKPFSVYLDDVWFNPLKPLFNGNTFKIEYAPNINEVIENVKQQILTSNGSGEGTQISGATINIYFQIAQNINSCLPNKWFTYDVLQQQLLAQTNNYNFNGLFAKVEVIKANTDFVFANEKQIIQVLENNNLQIKKYIHLNELFKGNVVKQHINLEGSTTNLTFALDNLLLNAYKATNNGMKIQYCNTKPQDLTSDSNTWTWVDLPLDDQGKALISIDDNVNRKFLAIRYVPFDPTFDLWSDNITTPQGWNPNTAIIFTPEELAKIKAIINLNSSILEKVIFSGNTKDLTSINTDEIYRQIIQLNPTIFNSSYLPNEFIDFEFSFGKFDNNQELWYKQDEFINQLALNNGHGWNQNKENLILLRENIRIRFNVKPQLLEEYNIYYNDQNIVDNSTQQINPSSDFLKGISIISETNLQNDLIGYIDINFIIEKGLNATNFSVGGKSNSPILSVNQFETLNNLFKPYENKGIFTIVASSLENNYDQSTTSQVIWDGNANKFKKSINLNFGINPLDPKFFIHFMVSEASKYVIYPNDLTNLNTKFIKTINITNIHVQKEVINPLISRQASFNPVFGDYIDNQFKPKYLQGHGSFSDYVSLNSLNSIPIDWTTFLNESLAQGIITQEMIDAIEIVYYVKQEDPQDEFTFTEKQQLEDSINNYDNSLWTSTKPTNLFVGQNLVIGLRVKKEHMNNFFLEQHSFAYVKAYGFMINPTEISINKKTMKFRNFHDIGLAPIDGLTHLETLSLLSNNPDPKIGKLMIQGINLSLVSYNKYHLNSDGSYIISNFAYLPYRQTTADDPNLIESGLWENTNIPRYVYKEGKYKGLPSAPIKETTSSSEILLSKQDAGWFNFVLSPQDNPNLYALYLNQEIGFKMSLVQAQNELPFGANLFYWNEQYTPEQLTINYKVEDGIKFILNNPKNIQLSFDFPQDANLEYKNPLDPSKPAQNGIAQISNPLSFIKMKSTSFTDLSLNKTLTSPSEIQDFLDLHFGQDNLKLTLSYVKTDGSEIKYYGRDINFNYPELQKLNNGDLIIFTITSDNYIIPFEIKPKQFVVENLAIESPTADLFKYLRVEQVGQINGKGGFKVLVNNPNDPNQVNDYNTLLGNFKFVARSWRIKDVIDSNGNNIKQWVILNNWTNANETANWNLSNGDYVEWKLVSADNENVINPYYNTISVQNISNNDQFNFANVNFKGNAIVSKNQTFTSTQENIGPLPPEAEQPNLSNGGMIISGLLDDHVDLNLKYNDFVDFINKLVANINYVGQNNEGWMKIKNIEELEKLTYKANIEQPALFSTNNNVNQKIITGKEILDNLCVTNNTTKHIFRIDKTQTNNRLSNQNELSFFLSDVSNYQYTIDQVPKSIYRNNQNPLIVYGLTQANDPLAPLWYALVGIGSVVLVGILGSVLLLSFKNKKIK